MTTEPPETTTADEAGRRSPLAAIGADWWAVIVAGVLVLLAGLGLLPSIPFLIK